jgi:hypothetical protein
MMKDRDELVAYLATLLTLLLVFVAALIAAGFNVSVTEAYGMGTITGGLIGLLRLPQRRAEPPADDLQAGPN